MKKSLIKITNSCNNQDGTCSKIYVLPSGEFSKNKGTRMVCGNGKNKAKKAATV